MVEWCPKCNAQLPPGLEECPRCGHKLHPSTSGEFTTREILWLSATLLRYILIPLIIIIAIVWLIFIH